MSPSTDPGGRIDTDTLKRERPLADVVASYGIVLRREGAGTYRALCPFHQERTPSFWIDGRDARNEHYFCFGCSSHGDVITFVMERESCSFSDACERLSGRGRPALLENAPRTEPKSNGRRWEDLPTDSTEARVLDVALQVYQAELWQNNRAQAYLRARAIPEDVARAQRLGYADGGALLRWLRHESHAELLPVAVSLGLVQERPDPGSDSPINREFFFDRLIIPELRDGVPIWCIGRAIQDPPASTADTPNGGSPTLPVRPRPKYLGLPGEKPVIGLERVVGRHVAYITEGPFDVRFVPSKLTSFGCQGMRG